jgi:hypothetical protein
MQIMDRNIENKQWDRYGSLARDLGIKTGLVDYLRGYTEKEEEEILRRVGKIIETPDKRKDFWKAFTTKYDDTKLWMLATRSIALADEKKGNMYMRMSGCKGVCPAKFQTGAI